MDADIHSIAESLKSLIWVGASIVGALVFVAGMCAPPSLK